MPNNVIWGMIGCGNVTEKKSGPAFQKCESSSLKAVYSRTYEKAKDYAKRHNIPTVYENVDGILADDEITAVYIATPPSSHKEYVIRCLEAGKIPYVEKPMAQTAEECEEMMDVSKRCGIPIYVAYYRREMEKFRKIQELLEDEVIGNVQCVQVHQYMQPEKEELDKDTLPWRLKKDVSGGGKFVDMAVHTLDILQYWFGDITKVQGISKNMGKLYEVEDTVSAVFETEKGIMISGQWCYTSSFADEKVLIIGTKGVIETSILSYGDVNVKLGDKEKVYSFVEPDHVAMPMIQSITNEILGKGKSAADLESAANVSKVVEALI